MRILETTLYGENLEDLHSFYTQVLGLQVISYDPQRNLFLRLEDSVLIVFKASKTIVPDAGIPPHGAQGAGHIAFQATRVELDKWKTDLIDKGVPVIQEVTWANGALSIYFRDPAGNILEIATRDLWFGSPEP